MKNTVILVVTLMTLMTSFGCEKRSKYRGSNFGSQAIQGTNLLNCYVLQFDTYTGQFDDRRRKPLFAILWKAKMAGSIESNGRNYVTAIHGHKISPPVKRMAVYALQSDYGLKEIPLSREDAEHVFRLQTANKNFEQDVIWKRKVAPHLHIIDTKE